MWLLSKLNGTLWATLRFGGSKERQVPGGGGVGGEPMRSVGGEGDRKFQKAACGVGVTGGGHHQGGDEPWEIKGNLSCGNIGGLKTGREE